MPEQIDNIELRNNLIHASLNGDLDYVKSIFNSNLITECDVSTVCQMFMISSTNGHLNIVKSIFDTKEFKSQINKASFLKNSIAKVFPTDHLPVIEFLLEKLKPFNMNIDNIISLGINECIKRGHLNVIQYFLEQKEPSNLVWNKYITGEMLNTACSYGHLNIVQYLMESDKLYPKIDIHMNQDVAFKAIHFNDRLDIIKYMIFDLNLEKTLYIEKHLEQYTLENNDIINQWFNIKKFNNDLTSELEIQQSTLLSKKAKI